MAHTKKHGPAPVPPANRPQSGPVNEQGEPLEGEHTGDANTGASSQEQDPKRRLGNFSGAGEHPYQQPGGLNDANR